jgi:hypothetical protein
MLSVLVDLRQMRVVDVVVGSAAPSQSVQQAKMTGGPAGSIDRIVSIQRVRIARRGRVTVHVTGARLALCFSHNAN